MNRSVALLARKRRWRSSEEEEELDNSDNGCGVYDKLTDDDGEVKPESPPPTGYKRSQMIPKSIDHHAYPKLSDVDPTCRLCLAFGHRQTYVTPQGQRVHAMDHLTQAAGFLHIDESSVPVLDDRMMSKCFPPRATTAPVPPVTTPKPPALPQKVPIAPIVSDFNIKNDECSSRPSSNQHIGGTARIGKCKPLFVEESQVKVKEEEDEDPSWEEDQEDQEEEEEEEEEEAEDADAKPSRNPRNTTPKTVESRRNKEKAVEQLVTIYNNPLLRTNFELVAGGIWPMFIANGYRYRLSRVYNNGKCELRCASHSVCKGKAIIKPDEPYPYYLQAVDNHSHEPLANNKQLGATGKKFQFQKKKQRK